MLIELDQVREEPFEWRETREVSPAEIDRDVLTRLSPVDFGGRISFVDPGFYLDGRLRYEQTLECDRCLAAYSEPVDQEVELLLVVEEHGGRPAQGEQEERQLGEEDLGVLALPTEKVDTLPIMLEQIQLNVPMKPLCREDCKGLCPRCGADLNRQQCSCEGEETDPRWQALAGLKARLGDDS